VKAGRALTSFEPFSRDAERHDLLCTARGGFSLLMSAEIQPCFNNAFLELLTAPRSEREAALTYAALRLLCDHLPQHAVVACFALSPADNEHLALAYRASGFRRSGLLRAHLLRNGARTDAFLWSRKLASSTDP
jgi:hypothetical protein